MSGSMAKVFLAQAVPICAVISLSVALIKLTLLACLFASESYISYSNTSLQYACIKFVTVHVYAYFPNFRYF